MNDDTFQSQADEIARAAQCLERGALIGLPTETVYGLGADATNPLAIAAIYEAKARPRFNPLISHVSSLEAAIREGVFSPLALELARTFWPGPLTLVVPRQPGASISDLACAGLATVALRVPSHPLTVALLHAFGRPIAAPSANVSGRPSPTTAAHVHSEMGDKVAMILDGGPCEVGLESAVVAVSGNSATLLRLGGLERAQIEAVCGPLLSPNEVDRAAPASPGMILRHYAPNAPVMLNQTNPPVGAVMIGFGTSSSSPGFNLSPSGDLRQAAANLFAYLRKADAQNPTSISVAPIPALGLGEAINDRLMRAADGQKSHTL
jgi:L-threonylcarbamoyladenylate synthase